MARAVVQCQADSSEVYIHFQVCYLGSKADGWLGVLPERVVDSSVGDSANCHRSPADWNKEWVAGDTRCSADGKGFPIPPTRCGCSRPVATTNSIPIPSIPTAG